jgi:hypothetical protein
MAGHVRIGISGWRYAPWRGRFYPKDLKQAAELAFAARHFDSIELNGSFYSLQSPALYSSWREATPEDFVFAVKGQPFPSPGHARRRGTRGTTRPARASSGIGQCDTSPTPSRRDLSHAGVRRAAPAAAPRARRGGHGSGAPSSPTFQRRRHGRPGLPFAALEPRAEAVPQRKISKCPRTYQSTANTRIVLKQPPPSFLAPQPAASPRRSLLMGGFPSIFQANACVRVVPLKI